MFSNLSDSLFYVTQLISVLFSSVLNFKFSYQMNLEFNVIGCLGLAATSSYWTHLKIMEVNLAGLMNGSLFIFTVAYSITSSTFTLLISVILLV